MDNPIDPEKPIEFASRTRVAAHDHLLRDFIQRVLELPWTFVSDESTLWDFGTGEDSADLLRRIVQIYAVDVSDIPSGNIADILDRISRVN